MLTFNTYSTPLLIGFLQGVIYALMLFRRSYREDRLSDRLLAGLLVVGCAYIMQYMLGFGGWYDSHDWRSTFMFYFPFYLLIFVGPLMYFYFLSLTNHTFRFRAKDLWHFVPGALIIAVYISVFLHDVLLEHWILGKPFTLHFGTQGPWSKLRQEYVPLVEIGLLPTILYTFLTIRVYSRYRRYLADNFSMTAGIRFEWLRLLLYAIIGTLAVNWGVQILALFLPFSYQQFWMSHFAFAIMIYFLAIQGYEAVLRTPRALQFEPEEPTVAAVRAQEKEEDEEELKKWKERIQKYFDEEKPHLEPQLTLSELAQRLQTNTSVLSRVINTAFDQNFNDFINDFRVRAVRKKLERGEARQLTFMSIALDCGFNSKATFNRAFRKHTGMSPREYLERVEEIG